MSDTVSLEAIIAMAERLSGKTIQDGDRPYMLITAKQFASKPDVRNKDTLKLQICKFAVCGCSIDLGFNASSVRWWQFDRDTPDTTVMPVYVPNIYFGRNAPRLEHTPTSSTDKDYTFYYDHQNIVFRTDYYDGMIVRVCFFDFMRNEETNEIEYPASYLIPVAKYVASEYLQLTRYAPDIQLANMFRQQAMLELRSLRGQANSTNGDDEKAIELMRSTYQVKYGYGVGSVYNYSYNNTNVY